MMNIGGDGRIGSFFVNPNRVTVELGPRFGDTPESTVHRERAARNAVAAVFLGLVTLSSGTAMVVSAQEHNPTLTAGSAFGLMMAGYTMLSYYIGAARDAAIAHIAETPEARAACNLITGMDARGELPPDDWPRLPDVTPPGQE